ncbi:MAG: hypothetical protein IMY71_04510 [Bacteroidetes bacterium]|nr:hypothetical protein [Bacteroidota bacterium]
MKKNKNIISLIKYLLIIICFIPRPVFSQVELYKGSEGSYNPFGTSIAGDYMRVYEIPYHSSLLGTPYLNEEWENADIILSHDDLLVKDIPIRIDVMNNWLEVKLKGKVFLLYVDDTHSLFFKNSNDAFITGNGIAKNSPAGFYKVIYNEKSSVFCHYSTKIKEATYIPAFNVGEKDDKIIIEKTYYAFINNQLIELEKNKKKLIQQFKSNKEIITFIKHNNINPTKEQDLIKFIKYYDSI